MDQDPDLLLEQLRDDPAGRADPGAVLGRVDHPRCRHAEVNRALRDRALPPPVISPDQAMGDLFHRWLIYTTGEQHRQLRTRFSGYFGPRQAEGFHATIESRVVAILDEVVPRGRMDVVADLVHPVTFPLICDTMGVPGPARPELLALTEVFEDAIPRQSEPEWATRGTAATSRMMDVFDSLLADRREHPQPDFLGELATRPLGDAEEWRDVAANCVFLLANAFSTTPTLMAGSIALALDHPALVERLRAGEFTTEAYVDECARLLCPVTYGLRGDGEDGWDTYYLAGANRDPAVFPEPDRLDPTRRPNRHLSFFTGPHACLGASVARLLAGVTLDLVLARLPGLRRAGASEWASAYPLHRLAALPVAWDPPR